ncbi:MAG: MBOAT family O-acyltransferase [Oscillospiraceae bacterium]
MTFTSVLFLFRFLPIFLLLYYVAPAKIKNTVLLLGSLFFYAWEEIGFLPWLAGAIVLTYLCALGISKFTKSPLPRRLLFLIGVGVNLGLLVWVKYTGEGVFAPEAWLGTTLLRAVLPLGISFYIFRSISYLRDVLRQDNAAEKNIVDFGVYCLFFPVVASGPFIQYKDMLGALKSPKTRISLAGIDEGISLFIIGLAKKVLLAGSLGSLWAAVMGRYSNGALQSGGSGIGLNTVSTPLAWLLLLTFALWLYFELSGYISMGQGLAAMLGFSFPASFSSPYTSRSLTQFGSAWHGTLSGWFKRYIYLPLCGKAPSGGKKIFALFITCLLFGLWLAPGLNFILLALYLFVVLVVEQTVLLPKLKKAVIWPHLYLFIVLIPAMALFAAATPGAGLQPLFARLFTPHEGAGAIYYLRSYAAPLIISLICCTPLPAKLYGRVEKHKWLRLIVMAVLLLLSVVYLFRSNTGAGFDLYRTF